MQVKDLVFIPALITLGVTLLRLTGELLEGPQLLFGSQAGGGGALIGIVWLVPIFGIYFSRRLAAAGMRPESLGAAWGRLLLAIVLFVALAFAMASLEPAFPWPFLAIGTVSLAVMGIVMPGWRDMGRTLVVYGLAARIPVVIITALALAFSWDTHYNAPAPGVPELGAVAKFFWIGVLPQLTFWIAFTVVVGMLFGLISLPLWRRNVQQP